MALTKADDFPIHQTSEPIAYSGTDRNFYDRYFFNGYGAAGDTFFALAFGVYPQLNIADAAFCLVDEGVETALHASRWLGMERMDLAVGPISLEVVEPLRSLRLKVEAPEKGLRAEILFTGRAFPIEEPRFIRRQGPRAFMDYTRLTQNGRYAGWIELDGRRISVDGFMGTRDRSWGVRPVGARDSQEVVPPQPFQFYWIWSPSSFPEGSFFFHSNDDAAGLPWNRRAVWAPDGADAAGLIEMEDCAIAVDWRSNSRHARRAVVSVKGAPRRSGEASSSSRSTSSSCSAWATATWSGGMGPSTAPWPSSGRTSPWPTPTRACRTICTSRRFARSPIATTPAARRWAEACSSNWSSGRTCRRALPRCWTSPHEAGPMSLAEQPRGLSDPHTGRSGACREPEPDFRGG